MCAVVLAAHRPDAGVAPPTLDEWIDGLEAIARGATARPSRAAAATARRRSDCRPTGTTSRMPKHDDLGYAGAARRRRRSSTTLPWLRVATERERERAGLLPLGARLRRRLRRGGFDLQVGNPPWVRPRLGRRRPARRGRPVVAARRQAHAGAGQGEARADAASSQASASWSSTEPRTSRAPRRSSGHRPTTRTSRGSSPTSIDASWSRLGAHLSTRGRVCTDPLRDALH